jgi:eukaryotic-like serine/threonine-protein kinase
MQEPFGPYRLLARLGAGGMAEVLLAERAGAERPSPPLVIKRMLPALRRSAELRARFCAEGRLHAGLSHPGIVAAHEVGEVDGWPYIAMEHVHGADLARLCEALGAPLSPGCAARVVLALCDALEHVHAAGAVHRDVCPANVLLSTDGAVKLADFGVAAAPAEAGAPAGTYGYMAPEQIARGEADRRADVFSAGVILWELLAGRRLFFRGAGHRTLVAVVNEPAPALGDHPAADAISKRALAKDPEARYASCAALAADLRRAAAAHGWDTDAPALAALVGGLLP